MKEMIESVVNKPEAITVSFKENKVRTALQKSSPILILLVLIIIMSILSDNFFSASNFINIIKQSAAIGIIAIGQTLVVLTGGIDLSVGASMAFAGSLIAVSATQWGVSPVFALLIGISGGTLFGLLNGFIITRFKIQEFIATLGTMTIAQGFALFTTNGYPVSGIPESLLVVGSGMFLGVPISVFAFAIVAFAAWVLINHTTFGRSIIAIGGNKEASRVSGIKVNRTRLLVYVLCGFCCALSSVIMIGRLNSANALMGSGLELTAITAVALGGISLSGGVGKIGGAVIGVITIGVLNNGLDLINVTPYWQKVVLGTVIIAVVSFDTWRSYKIKK